METVFGKTPNIGTKDSVALRLQNIEERIENFLRFYERSYVL